MAVVYICSFSGGAVQQADGGAHRVQRHPEGLVDEVERRRRPFPQLLDRDQVLLPPDNPLSSSLCTFLAGFRHWYSRNYWNKLASLTISMSAKCIKGMEYCCYSDLWKEVTFSAQYAPARDADAGGRSSGVVGRRCEAGRRGQLRISEKKFARATPNSDNAPLARIRDWQNAARPKYHPCRPLSERAEPRRQIFAMP